MCFMHQGHCFDWLFLSKPVCLAGAIKWLKSHHSVFSNNTVYSMATKSNKTVFWSSRENQQNSYKICYIFTYKKTANWINLSRNKTCPNNKTKKFTQIANQIVPLKFYVCFANVFSVFRSSSFSFCLALFWKSAEYVLEIQLHGIKLRNDAQNRPKWKKNFGEEIKKNKLYTGLVI